MTELMNIIRTTRENLEGDCFYDNNFNRHNLVLKQRIAYSFAQHSNTIIEIGFNAGHSALLYLISNPHSKIYCFDICRHKYTQLCFDYLDRCFPNRLRMCAGASNTTLQEFGKSHPDFRADFINIDACHDQPVQDMDFLLSRQFATDKTLLTFGDVWIIHLWQLWRRYIQEGLVKELPIYHEPFADGYGYYAFPKP